MKIYTITKFVIILLSSIYILPLNASEINISDAKTKITIKSKTDSKIVFANSIGIVNSNIIQIEDNDYAILSANKYSKSEKIGYPDLPVLRKLMELPQGAEPRIKIISYDLKEYNLLLREFEVLEEKRALFSSMGKVYVL